MLTSKQRSILKGIAQTEDTIFQIGKGGINDNMVMQISDALRAREIVKIKALDNSMISAAEGAAELAEKTDSEVVQVIGNKIVLFRRNKKEPRSTWATLKRLRRSEHSDIRRQLQSGASGSCEAGVRRKKGC